MAEVLFKGGKIQTGDRVKIPKAVMDTLGLESGDKVLIKFDPENKRLVIEQEN
ncbi:MAG TPA: AbrB/MazE/SpoVT family DNA-binding domain-containing protein [Candidatus Nanoarchaeia archaeon]|nr:AbrB/MazE/SpoVT family DNA-binding domain-containing protein [Candidatus Nanoarchaeia archaeon]